jgi:hypothetical protein
VDQATFNINPIKPLIGNIPERPLTEQRLRIVYASNACHFFLFSDPGCAGTRAGLKSFVERLGGCGQPKCR